MQRVELPNQIFQEYIFTKNDVAEIKEIKKAFIQFLEKQGFRQYNAQDEVYLIFGDDITDLAIYIQTALTEKKEMFLLKAFNDEWKASFQSTEVENLKKIITEIKNHSKEQQKIHS